MMKSLIVGVALCAAASVAQAGDQLYYYGYGGVDCPKLTASITAKNEVATGLALSWVQGALTAVSAYTSKNVFPEDAVNQPLQFLTTAIRLRCAKHPEWKLIDVTLDIINAIPAGDSMFAPYHAPGKPGDVLLPIPKN